MSENKFIQLGNLDQYMELPVGREYIPVERAVAMLNARKDIKDKVEIDDIYYYITQGIFAPLVNIGKFFKDKRVRMRISHRSGWDERMGVPRPTPLSDKEFEQYLKALQVGSYNHQGYKINNSRIFRLDNMTPAMHKQSSATCKLSGYLNATPFDIDDTFSDMQLSAALFSEKKLTVVDFQFFIQRDRDEFKRFKNEWKSDIMVCETGLNEILAYIRSHAAVKQKSVITKPVAKVHGNTERNKNTDAAILKLGLTLKQEAPERCKNYSQWANYILDMQHRMEYKPRSHKHITKLLSKHEKLQQVDAFVS